MSTPGGIRTLSFVVLATRPSPRHSVHGFSIFTPEPPQVGQVWVKTMMPPDRRTWPAPRQVGQVTRLEPGSAPEPWQRVARDELAEGNLLLHPARRLLERDLEVVAKVGAVPASIAAAAPAPAEHLLKDAAAATALAEDLAEDVKGVVKSAGAGARAPAPGPWKAAWP